MPNIFDFSMTLLCKIFQLACHPLSSSSQGHYSQYLHCWVPSIMEKQPVPPQYQTDGGGEASCMHSKSHTLPLGVPFFGIDWEEVNESKTTRLHGNLFCY